MKVPRTVLSLMCSLLASLFTACSSSSNGPGWGELYQDPAGFSLRHPTGWTVKQDAHTGIIRVHGPQKEQVAIWPVLLPTDNEAALKAIHANLTNVLCPGGQWQPGASRPQGLALAGTCEGGRASSVLAWIVTPTATAGYAYLASAPSSLYRDSIDTFVNILSSFQFGAPESVPEVTWRDPLEGAFQLNFPQGWAVDGGMFRRAAIDTRKEVRAQSPDGAITIYIGDRNVFGFIAPSAGLDFTGYPEGSWYPVTPTLLVQVRHYQTGDEFASQYAQEELARDCASQQVFDARRRGDIEAAAQPVLDSFRSVGAIMTLGAGEIHFSCESGGRPIRGYLFADTINIETTGGAPAMWYVDALYGYRADETRAREAYLVLEKAVSSFRWDPGWLERQGQTTMAASRIFTAANESIASMIRGSYENRQQVLDELSRRRSNATLGVVDVHDPVTGEDFKVESGSNYYWIDYRGTVLGTDTPSQPAIQFHELLQQP